MKAARSLAIACPLLTALAPALAQQTDRGGLQVTVGTSLQTDSNLFRLPDDVSPAQAGFATDSRRETIITPFAELDGLLHGGTQTVRARARVARDLYDHNDNYDATRYEGEATWLGNFTRQWRSEASYGYEQSVTSFADFRNPQRNLLDASTARGIVSFLPRPDSRLSAYASAFRGRNSVEERRSSDYDVLLYRIEFVRYSAHGHEAAIGASRTDGRYPNREVVGSAPIDNSYRQEDIDARFIWRPGEATTATVRIGYADRDYDDVPERSFDGPTWLVSLAWEASGKTLLRLNTQRDLNAVDDFDRVYAVSDVHRVSLVHSLSAKISLGLDLSRQRINYAGDPQNFLTTFFGQAPARADRIDEVRLSLAWTPRDRYQLQLSAAHSERDSNKPGLQYRANVAQMTVQYRAF